MAIALSVAFTPTPVPAGQALVIYATQQVSAGINFMPRSKYRKLQTVAAAGASPSNILANYTAKFGALVSGQKIFIRLVPISTAGGQAGPEILTSVVVT